MTKGCRRNKTASGRQLLVCVAGGERIQCGCCCNLSQLFTKLNCKGGYAEPHPYNEWPMVDKLACWILFVAIAPRHGYLGSVQWFSQTCDEMLNGAIYIKEAVCPQKPTSRLINLINWGNKENALCLCIFEIRWTGQWRKKKSGWLFGRCSETIQAFPPSTNFLANLLQVWRFKRESGLW